MVAADEVQEMVNKRFEQYENGLTSNDVKNKTLSLKVRAQPNQTRGGAFGSFDQRDTQQEQLNELQQMRLEMTKEMRMMRQELKETIAAN